MAERGRADLKLSQKERISSVPACPELGGTRGPLAKHEQWPHRCHIHPSKPQQQVFKQDRDGKTWKDLKNNNKKNRLRLPVEVSRTYTISVNMGTSPGTQTPNGNRGSLGPEAEAAPGILSSL